MNMRINTLQSQALAQLAAQRMQNPAISGGAAAKPATLPVGTGPVQGTDASFSAAFKNALTAVSAAQKTASDMQNKVQMGSPDASLEGTMVAMQKAQIGFQTALNVRNRMVQAYSDIMNMQV